MHFATLPPEISSARMYSGPGSGPMIAAAAAWHGLATRLRDNAADYGSVTASLAQRWQGPTAMAMAHAVARHIEWLNTTAAHAEQAATRARAAASAYDAALAAMVPPAAIDANRARRRSLASNNCLGQAAAAIADCEAEYERIWADDTRAWYAYAGASADASKVTRFTSPPTGGGPARRPPPGPRARGNWALASAPDVISAGDQVMSTIPRALEALSLTPLATFDAVLSPVTSSLSKLGALSAPSGVAISHLNSRNKAAALRSLFPKPAGLRRPTITAGPGRGASIGLLSVPRTWTGATTPDPVAAHPKRGWVGEPIRLVKAGEPPG